MTIDNELIDNLLKDYKKPEDLIGDNGLLKELTKRWSFLSEILPFLKGFTLFFWAAGTWWIPLLFILGFWRHVYKRFPLRYDPQYWGMVFPLGMYTVCTLQLSKAINFAPLLLIPRYFIYLAIVGWLAAFVGLLHAFLPKPGRTASPYVDTREIS